MKAILLSIQPKWCEPIASGKKTVEVRKTRPKIETPFKCYIYCTKPSRKHQTICGCMGLNDDELYRHPTQGIKHGDSIELMCCDNYTIDNFLNGKVIGEFVCDFIEIIDVYKTDEGYGTPDCVSEYMLRDACLTLSQAYDYANDQRLYGWHIYDLEIYDKPKNLSEFKGFCKYPAIDCGDCPYYNYTRMDCTKRTIVRPPQSWCYVDELKNHWEGEIKNARNLIQRSDASTRRKGQNG